MHKWFYKIGFILLGLVCLALFLRLYDLGRTPAGFLEDEAHIGYNAYSLHLTGKDKDNSYLPLSVDQFGDFRPSGLHFLTVPSVAYFGLTEFATRFPVAIFGAIGIVVMYFLAYEIFQNRRLALLSSVLLCLNPWHLTASRITSESIVALTLVMGGAVLLLRFLRLNEKRIRFLPLFSLFCAALLFIISFQFYHAARYFVPFLLIYIVASAFLSRVVFKRNKFLLFVTAAAVAVGLFILFTIGDGGGRVANVSIFTHPATQIATYSQRIEDRGFPPIVVQFFHNSVVAYGYTALTNYGEHFSTSFLFFEGGFPKRYMIPWQGTFHYHDALLILVGLSLLVANFIQNNRRSFLLTLPVVWFFLGPIPAAFTFEDIPHFQRAIMMIPGGVMLVAYGAYTIVAAFRSKRARFIAAVSLVILAIYSHALFFHNYFYHSHTHESRYRNEGERELIETLQVYRDAGRPIITTSNQGNRVIFFLFYGKMDPEEFHAIGSPRDENELLLDGYLFKTDDCPSYTASNEIYALLYDTMYVDLGSCLPTTGVKTVKEILRPDGSIAFRILEIDTSQITPNE